MTAPLDSPLPATTATTVDIATKADSTVHKEVRKSNSEIGFRVQAGHLSLLARKLVNILLYYAQHMRGQEDEEGKFWVDAQQLIKDAKFRSRDYDLLRGALDELQSVRIIRPTNTGGITSDVLIPSFTLTNAVHLDNDTRAPGQKIRGGRLVAGFSFPAHIKDKLLDPRSNYTALPIIYVASLRTVGGIALYEIAKRYATNPGGVTNREDWQAWWQILTGANEGVAPPEYKYFKRDVLKKAISEVNTVTDVRVELIEYKKGRFVHALQFRVELDQQTAFDLEPPPLDTALLARITGLGLAISDAERLIQRYSEADLISNLAVVEARIANKNLPPIASTAAYLKSALKGSYGAGKKASVAAKQQANNAAQAARALAKDAEAEASAAKQARLEMENTAASDWYESLPDEQQDAVLSGFGESLVEPLAGMFRKSGLASSLVSKSWQSWLRAKNPNYPKA